MNRYGKQFMDYIGENQEPEGGPFSRMGKPGFTGAATPESEAEHLRAQGFSENEIRGALAASGIAYTAPGGAAATQRRAEVEQENLPVDEVTGLHAPVEVAPERMAAILRARYPLMAARLDRNAGMLSGDGLDMPS